MDWVLEQKGIAVILNGSTDLQNQVPYSYPYLSHYYLVHTWFFLDVYILNSQAAAKNSAIT